MTDKHKHSEFDPEKDKEVKNGPLKPKHKNQYGETSDTNDRNMAEREKGEKDKKNNS